MENKPCVINETEKYVAKITLNSPETGNVINKKNLELLRDFLKAAIISDDCRLIIIQGKDGVFCRGMDFKGIVKDSSRGFSKSLTDPYKDILNLIHTSPKPVVSYIDGEVLAGGMGIALICDIVLATKNSTFGLSEVLFGIIPAFVTPVLLTRTSLKKLQYLILTSKKINADEAYNIGLVDHVLEPEKAGKILKDYIKRILYSSPEALALTKKFANKVLTERFEDALELAQDQLTELLNDKKNTNAIKSFLDGDRPEWAVTYK